VTHSYYLLSHQCFAFVKILDINVTITRRLIVKPHPQEQSALKTSQKLTQLDFME